LSTVVGPECRRLDDELDAYGGNRAQLDRIKRTIGLNERWVAPPGVTALDLGAQAAAQLLAELGIEATKVDGLIFVTQTPDFSQPCNAALLQARLKMTSAVAAFDVNLGCSGFVYGLYLASLMVESGGCQRVLLVVADTVSQLVHPRDRSVAPLFGDAASAALVERTETEKPAWYALHTDGRGAQAIMVPAGGAREPIPPAAQAEQTDAEGNVRTRANLHMNGAEVFTFSIREEPPAIEAILRLAGWAVADVDAFLFHQANRYIIHNIAKRLKLPLDRVPADIVERYGNQSGASIPSTACVALGERLQSGPLRLVLAGFGVGLSWATACVTWGPLRACSLRHFGK